MVGTIEWLVAVVSVVLCIAFATISSNACFRAGCSLLDIQRVHAALIITTVLEAALWPAVLHVKYITHEA